MDPRSPAAVLIGAVCFGQPHWIGSSIILANVGLCQWAEFLDLAECALYNKIIPPRKDASPLKEVKTPSVLPIYGIGAVWLLYNLCFPMYKLWHLLLCTVLSAAVYLLLRKLCPPTVTYVKEPDPEPDTGNRQLDDAIRQGRNYIREIRRLNDEIPDQSLSDDLEEIERLTTEIFRQIEKSPEKLPKIRKMMNYFLPTTLKLVGKYAELQGQSALENVRTMLEEIRQLVSSVKAAFRKQLDNLYEHDVVDVTADIQVMEQMLSAHGLTDSADFKKEN